MKDARRVPLISAGLFVLNAIICFPLFRVEYLDQFQSVEGTFMTFGKFLVDHFPHTAWFPWFDAGMAFEYTYLPLTTFLVAILEWLARFSPARAVHVLGALTYSVAPVFLFWFVRKLTGRIAPGVWAALLWSLFSPSVLVPEILQDTGSLWVSRRLKNIVFYGEVPHNLALCLLPLALLLLARSWEKPGPRRFVLAVLAAAAIMLSNAFGIVVISISFLILIAARQELRWTESISAGAILLSAYLLICRFLPPSLIQLIRTNSQLAGGDYRFTAKSVLLAGLFVLAMIGLWGIARRRSNPALQFALLFAACFGGITMLSFWTGLGFLPQPRRYHIEMDAGLCMLASLALEAAFRRLPRKTVAVAAGLGMVALSWLALKNYEYARGQIRPVDIAQTAIFQEAQWINANLPGQRIMVSGDGEPLFNLFSNNPQLSAGHDPTAPNWMERVAVYTIYTGQNAGDQDGPIAVFWLKVYGCGAITVPGPGTRDYYHPVRNPRKFDGLLPLVWRKGDDSIYRVPLRSPSLAHVIPVSAVVKRQPEHGLDLDPVRAYAAALDDPALPPASLTWENPEHGRISARIGPSQVLSVQMTYDRGWIARAGGQPARVRPDQLGMIVIEPTWQGDGVVDLEFTGGWERKVCSALGIMTLAALLSGLSLPGRRKARVQ
jgi:hypothetical protein